MKRVEFLIEDTELAATQAAAESLGISQSEFIRLAMAEKREWANPVIELRAIRAELQDFMQGLREQMAASHAAVLEAHRKGLAEARAEVAKTLRATEAANQKFLDGLVEVLAPAAAPSRPAKDADVKWKPPI